MSSASRFYRAVLSSSLGTALSRIAGLARTVAVAAFLGAGVASDAWNIAWTVPNAFRRFVADEGLTGALIPAVADAEEHEGLARAQEVANTTLAFLAVACTFIVAALLLFSEQAVLAFAFAFKDDPEQLALAVSLLRLTAPLVFLVSLTSFLEGLLNHRDHYFVPKVAPAILSIGMVAGVATGESLGVGAAHGLGWGALVGGVAHALINVPVVWRLWGPIGLRTRFADPRFRALAKELSKVVVIGLVAQVNILALRQLTTSVAVGATTHYDNAVRLVDLAQGIIAVGIGSALLPALAKAAAAHDEAALGKELTRSLRLAAFLLLPASAVLAGFGLPSAAMVLRLRAYTLADVEATALTMAVMTPFMLSVAGINLLKKVFFAYNWRNALLGVGIIGVGLTVGLGWWLKEDFGLMGVAGALSASTVLQFVIYGVLLKSWLGDDVRFEGLASGIGRMVLCTLPAAAWFWLATPFGEWGLGPFSARNWAVFAAGFGGGAGLYLGASYALGVEELTRFVALVRRKMGR